MDRSPILGTRGSALALAQAHKVASALEVANRWPANFIEIQAITTSGDVINDRPLAEIGGKALWTKELDRALLEGEVDFCVHSMKDVESERPKSIRIAAVRPRGDMRERLIGAESIEALKQGAVGIEVAADRPELRQLVEAIDHRPTSRCVAAERAFLAAIGGDCRSAVAAHAVIDGEGVRLRAEILMPDGTEVRSGEDGDPEALARRLLALASPGLRAMFAP